MAQKVYLALRIAGTDVEGESTVTSLDREKTIVCSSFSWGINTARDAADGTIAGKRLHQPVKIIKRIDKHATAC